MPPVSIPDWWLVLLATDVSDSETLCAACGAPGAQLHFEKAGTEILRCGSCNLLFCPQEPTTEQAIELYSEEYFVGGGGEYADYLAEEPSHRAYGRRVLRRMRALGLTMGTLLDVGCATGFFMDEARAQGWRVAGCDVSLYAGKLARERFGLEVQIGNFLDLAAPSEPYDVVSLLNVLPHIAQPAQVEQKLRSIVRPGGHVLIETWNSDSWVARLQGESWHQLDPRYVPYYFGRRSLARLFSEEHWVMRAFQPVLRWISLRRGLDVIARKSAPKWLAPGLRRLANSRLGATNLPYGLGDLVFVVLQRSRDFS